MVNKKKAPLDKIIKEASEISDINNKVTVKQNDGLKKTMNLIKFNQSR